MFVSIGIMPLTSTEHATLFSVLNYRKDVGMRTFTSLLLLKDNSVITLKFRKS